MGLLMSVALGKEKLYAWGCGGGRRSVRARVGAEAVGAGVHGGGGSPYGVLGGDDMLGVEEEKAAAAGVESGGGAEAEAEVAAAAAASGGTPARPIWQRRVLMGVKCQLPRFSGMILYDERGRPVRSGLSRDRDRARDQEKHAAAISVLRDLL
ncbi:hypothetical protein U9M48_038314 [Paspalum notatum var. saurae]|uniref:Uncharacterized protein n=1 Tax=Paspalum notatum var. saurae TaxID=547442 RepID=A0AAQ3XDE9_PASNO